MQENPITRLDLTSDPSQANPTPAAKVAKFSNRMSQVDPRSDIEGSDDQSGEGIRTVRTRLPGRSTLTVHVSFWPPRAGLQFRVEGNLSWAAPFSAVVLVLSILAGIAVPSMTLEPDTPLGTWFSVAATSAGSVLAAGLLCLLLLYKRK